MGDQKRPDVAEADKGENPGKDERRDPSNAGEKIKKLEAVIEGWRWGNSGWSCCRMGNHPATSTTVTNARFQRLGYVEFCNYYWKKEHQTKLF
jgi:hypothetical protein